MWDDFKDTLDNAGLPEAWLECYSNNVAPIKNKFIKRESNWIGKTYSNPFENSESNQVRNNDSNQVGTSGQRRSSDADYGASVRYLMVQWSGLWSSGGVLAVIVTLTDNIGP